MRVFYQFDYDALPRNVKKHLIRSVKNPDFLVHGQVMSSMGWYLLHGFILAVCTFFIYLLAASNFGNPLQDKAWTDTGLLFWYAVLFLGVVYAAHAIWQRMQLNTKFRFLPGWYLFPLALVDMRSSKIAVHDLAQLRKLESRHDERDGKYKRTIFSFSFNDGSQKNLIISNLSQAEAALKKFNVYKSKARDAFHQRDIASLYGYDPLLDVRKNKWKEALGHSGKNKQVLKLSSFLKLPLLLIMLATVLATLFWYGRNAVADKKMYLHAKQQQTESAYLGYIAHGKFKVTEMQDELPRVLFKEALNDNSVTHLRKLKARFPHADILPEVEEEIHMLYFNALQKFRAQAVNADAKLLRSVESLLKFSEEHDDPNVPIKFTRPTATELGQLDASLKNREKTIKDKKIVPAAKYFSDDSVAVREARIANNINKAFSSIFPSDILNFSAATGGNDNRPSLEITYQVEPSGKLFASVNTNEVYAGLSLRFNAVIVIPESKDRWKFNLQVDTPDYPNTSYIKSSLNSSSDTAQSDSYTSMTGRAFDELEEKINQAMFRPDSAVYLKQQKNKI